MDVPSHLHFCLCDSRRLGRPFATVAYHTAFTGRCRCLCPHHRHSCCLYAPAPAHCTFTPSTAALYRPHRCNARSLLHALHYRRMRRCGCLPHYVMLCACLHTFATAPILPVYTTCGFYLNAAYLPTVRLPHPAACDTPADASLPNLAYPAFCASTHRPHCPHLPCIPHPEPVGGHLVL